ncbi:MAG TPA: AI-2E family transporter [Candidatus Paceibacterota bacterium]|jgi:predicted PurR-regulated permease PerM|nr:AI-2E family transporter [Candidatus Paceibacterota bacterium]
MEKREYEISWATLWRILIFVVLIAVFYEGREILLGLFLAIVISSGLEGLVNLLERAGLPRSLSVILIFLIILFVIVFIIYSLTPVVIVELNTIFSGAGKVSASGSLAALLSSKAAETLSNFASQLSSSVLTGSASPLTAFSNAIGSVGLAVAVILCSFYLTLTKDGVERFMKVVFPPSYEETALRVYERSKKLIGTWFKTQILMSLIMGVTVWIGLAILHVPYALLIASLAAIFELVPFVGPFLSGALAVIAALSVSSTLAIYTLIFFIIAQQFESNVLVPILSQQLVGLHPVIVIVALLIGAEIGGFLGIVISVPAAGVFQEVIQEWSTKRRRSDS